MPAHDVDDVWSELHDHVAWALRSGHAAPLSFSGELLEASLDSRHLAGCLRDQSEALYACVAEAVVFVAEDPLLPSLEDLLAGGAECLLAVERCGCPSSLRPERPPYGGPGGWSARSFANDTAVTVIGGRDGAPMASHTSDKGIR